jgi:hypothetical protein
MYDYTDKVIDEKFGSLSPEQKEQVHLYVDDLNVRPERRTTPIPLWIHVIIISTFPFAMALVLMSTPVVISGITKVASVSGFLGVAGMSLARRRRIRIEDTFLLFMLMSLSISTVFIAPVFAADIVLHRMPPLVAASFLYGINLVLYLMLYFGLYGVVVNFLKPQDHLVDAWVNIKRLSMGRGGSS